MKHMGEQILYVRRVLTYGPGWRKTGPSFCTTVRTRLLIEVDHLADNIERGCNFLAMRASSTNALACS